MAYRKRKVNQKPWEKQNNHEPSSGGAFPIKPRYDVGIFATVDENHVTSAPVEDDERTDNLKSHVNADTSANTDSPIIASPAADSTIATVDNTPIDAADTAPAFPSAPAYSASLKPHPNAITVTVETTPADTAPVDTAPVKTANRSSNTTFDRSALDAAKHHLRDFLISIGHEPDHNGMLQCVCRNHADEHPSMKFNADTNTVHCFACQFHGDIVDVIAEVENLTPNSKDAIDRAIAFAGIAPRGLSTQPTNKTVHNKIDRVKQNIRDWHQIMSSDCHAKLAPVNYLKSRGFSDSDIETFINAFGLGYNPIANTLIIPHGDDYYTARSIDPNCNKADRFKHNANSPVKLFNPNALHQPVCFLAEGPIDALSIIACGFPAVALGGAQNYRLLLKTLDNLEHPPIIIITFDNDKAGNDAAVKLAERITECSCLPAVIANIPAPHHDINDFFRADKDACISFLQTQIDCADDSMHDTPARQHNIIRPAETSDKAIAQYIVDTYPDLIRYNTDRSKFMLYQPPIWHTLNKDSELRLVVNDFSRALHDSTHRIDKKIALQLQSSKAVDYVIKMFYSFRSLRISDNDLNNHPWLFPCNNGVVDLTNGRLYPHDGKQLWTIAAPVNFDPNTKETIFHKFISEVVPDRDTRDVLQSFLGYCLTGSVEEEKALFVHGSGGNGKGTLFGAIQRCLGDFATPLKIDCLLAGRRSQDANAASPEFNKLLHARLAVADEVPQGQKLDVAQFKLLTGGDQLPIRLLHHEAAAIKQPTHKLILSGNHLPALSDPNDEGLKRRLLVVRFPASFTDHNRDPKLKAKLAQPDVQSDILNWLLHGCLRWQQEGLKESTAMQLECQDYLTDNDLVAAFVDEFCVLGKDKSVSRKALIEHVRKHAERDLRTMRDKDIIDAFTKLDGVECKKTMVGRVLFGIAPVDDADFEPYQP